MPPLRSDADAVEQAVDLRGVEAGGRLVDQQKLRPRGERARELEHALLAVGQRARRARARRAARPTKSSSSIASSRQRALVAPESRAMHQVLPGRNVVMDVKARDHVLEHARAA